MSNPPRLPVTAARMSAILARSGSSMLGQGRDGLVRYRCRCGRECSGVWSDLFQQQLCTSCASPTLSAVLAPPAIRMERALRAAEDEVPLNRSIGGRWNRAFKQALASEGLALGDTGDAPAPNPYGPIEGWPARTFVQEMPHEA